MLDKQTLENMATKAQTHYENVAREYSQHVFLQRLYQEKEAGALLFKGGTALRIVYQSPRYSEDLDFSVESMKIPEIEDLMLETLLSLQDLNLATEIRTSKKTSSGYLGIFLFEIHQAQISIKVEVSQRNDHPSLGQPEMIDNPYFAGYNLMVLSQDILVDGKLAALLDRGKARDWFDLYFMLRARMLNQEHKQKLSLIKSRLTQNEDDFYDELEILLPKSFHRLIKDFNQVLSRELTRFVG